MKKVFFVSMAFAILISGSGCKKENKPVADNPCNSLPHTAAPSGLAGNWSSGYSSLTLLVDTYNGRYLGNAWQSGKFFKITGDGTAAEFYYMAQSQYSQTATKVTGTIAFDAGATPNEGSFTFYACQGHYKGWGSINVDRDATAAELANNLTLKYYYKTEGQWLRIEPNGPVNAYSSSFKAIN